MQGRLHGTNDDAGKEKNHKHIHYEFCLRRLDLEVDRTEKVFTEPTRRKLLLSAKEVNKVERT